jgi:hypothetical protein
VLERAQYDKFRVSPGDPSTLRCSDVEKTLAQLAGSSDGRLRVEKYAESLEKRPIHLVTLGDGPKRILLWSQMHGDEPTHTAVLLDLMSYLLQMPAQPQAADILANCTLLMIPLLNPDGAERYIRFNAQGIDINRDWRRQVTPEGRTLLRAAKTLKPQFGFNLHNQNARTTVGRPPLLAAVSVLAPAPDASRKVSPSMQTAKQMCTCFVEAVRPFAQGMISRYDDSHEPRAFGDGIQSLGVATMLVEAGGWPEADVEPMTRLHFHGLLNTLQAIATDKHLAANPQIYEDLPESNSTRLNDCYITKGQIFDTKVAAPFVADLLIDQTHSQRLWFTSRRDGKIIEIGDLPPAPSALTINASDSLILPGQISMVKDWKPGSPLNEQQINDLLARGTTTAIGVGNLADREEVDAMAASQTMPLNWAYVGDADGANKLSGIELFERLAVGASNGMLAVASAGTDETLWRYASELGLTLLKPDQLPSRPADKYQDAAKQSWTVANALKLQSRRGQINRDYIADLIFFAASGPAQAADTIEWKQLNRVMVAGETVWEHGKRTGCDCGVQLLSRSGFPA